jgi:ubiquinone/menaquinone biosynthesis C-methylase UbiE
MGTIKDSNAYQNKDKMLIQHQAALSVLQGKLENPDISDYNWLDLGCGKGQIIINLENNLGEGSIKKINYFAFDLKDDFLNLTLKQAESQKFKSVKGETGDFTNFSKLFPEEKKFDFITLTNSIHELNPYDLSVLLFETVIRLSDTGILYFYDMETLSNRELGAVSWKADEIHRVVKAFLITAEIENYSPKPGRWPHSSCNGWSLQMHREYLKKSDEELNELKEEIIKKCVEEIDLTLSDKLEECIKSLESFTKHGTETSEDESLKLDLLYDFWAINRIKNNKK